jgi:hypothetical protein
MRMCLPGARASAARSSAASKGPLKPEETNAVGIGALQEAVELPIQAVEHGRIAIAQLEQRLGLARDDALLAGIEFNAPCGPHRARSADFRKAGIDRAEQAHQFQAGVASPGHRGRTGVVLLALDRQAILPNGDDGRDDADLEAQALERIALLDVRLEKSGVAFRIDPEARSVRPASHLQGFAHRHARDTVEGPIELPLFERADERAAAEETAEVALFIAEHRHIDANLPGRGVRGNGTRSLQGIDAPQGPVEPSGIVLALQMRAGEDLATGSRALAEDIADAIDGGTEIGLRQSTREPFAGRDVLRGERWTVHTALVSSERSEGAQVGKDPLRLDLGHCLGSRRQDVGGP